MGKKRISTVVLPERDGHSVKSIMEHELSMSEALIKDVKLRSGGILLNDERVYVTASVRALDVLCVEASDKSGVSSYIEPVEAPLDILYEDEFFIVINKQAGIAVHRSTRGEREPTVESALAYYLGSDCGIHPLNRLDRGTTGIMTIAKSAYSCELLRRALHTDAFFREYIGVAVGDVQPSTGSIDLPTGFAEGSRYKRAVVENGLASLSEYEALASGDGLTLLRLVPCTGRTHQLRLHMSAIGFPLAGDWLYGEENAALIARPALHSYYLRLRHPVTGEALRIYAPLPDDMQKLASRIPGAQNALDKLYFGGNDS